MPLLFDDAACQARRNVPNFGMQDDGSIRDIRETEADSKHVFGNLSVCFGNDIRQSVGRSIVTAWATDPWTFGSYASALPGQFHQREALPRPIDDKLFFAGEANARANGTCNGAYWSGVRAAREVAEVLK